MAKYIVMTNGRYSPDYPEMHPKQLDSLTMDVRSIYGRTPMTLIQAKQRAAEVVNKEPGVRAYICKVEYIAEVSLPPVRIRKVDNDEA